MGRTRDRRRDGCQVRRNMRAGQAMTECVLVLPFFILIFIGVLDLGRAFHTHIALSNAARAGVIYAQQVQDPATGQAITVTGIINNVLAEPPGGINTSALTVTVCVPFACYPYQPGVTTSTYTQTLTYGEPITVTVTSPFTAITPLVHLVRISSSVYGSTFAEGGPLNAAVLPAEQTAAAETATPPQTCSVSANNLAALMAGNGYYYHFTTGATGPITATWNLNSPDSYAEVDLYSGQGGSKWTSQPGGAASDHPTGSGSGYITAGNPTVTASGQAAGSFTAYFYENNKGPGIPAGTTATITYTNYTCP